MKNWKRYLPDVLVVLLFTFNSAGMPLLLILVIEGSIWINFSFPTISGKYLFFLGYLIVSSIQMGANIDYAIVIGSQPLSGAEGGHVPPGGNHRDAQLCFPDDHHLRLDSCHLRLFDRQSHVRAGYCRYR